MLEGTYLFRVTVPEESLRIARSFSAQPASMSILAHRTHSSTQSTWNQSPRIVRSISTQLVSMNVPARRTQLLDAALENVSPCASHAFFRTACEHVGLCA
jgi:hypothetical protein